MGNVIELSRPVKPAPGKRVFGWIVKIDGQRAQIPATFPQILRLMPAILGGNDSEKACAAMKEKLTPLTESERELLSRSAAYLEQGIIKDFHFSSRDILRLNATVEAAEARANSLHNKLQIASLKAKQDELAILKEQEKATSAKLELERAEAEVSRLKLKCGEKAPDGACIFYFEPAGQVLCPKCERGIASPWDEPGMHMDSNGWHGIVTCHNCSSKIEVHSQHKHFWTAKLANETNSPAVEGK